MGGVRLGGAARRLALPAVVCLSLAAAGFALAGTPVVRITASGPVPADVSVPWGGTVRFTNVDSVEHSVKVSGAGGGRVSIAPGESYAAVFSGRSGVVRYSVNGQHSHVRGTVDVGLSGRLTLDASAKAVVYGQKLRLSGRSTLGRLPVTVEAEPLDQARQRATRGEWTSLATVKPRADGSFALSIEPAIGARYRATTAGSQLRSSDVHVRVMPSISETIATSLVFGKTLYARARVSPASAASRAVLERFVPAQKRWVAVARGEVRGGQAVLPWQVDRAGKLELRIELAANGVASGFEGATGEPVSVAVAWPPTTLKVKVVTGPPGAGGSPGRPRWNTAQLSAHPGRITLEMVNLDAAAHNVAIRGGGVSVKGAVVSRGGTSTVTVKLPAGKYTFYSSSDGTKTGLAAGTLVVR